MTTPTTVQVRLQIRADTAANWTSFSPVLLANELGLETDTKKFKIGDGNTSWQSLAYFPSIVSGGTVLGNLEIGTTGTLTFEGSTANGFETTLGVVDPTADRTILLPNQSGTVVVGGNASIVDADIAANAEIAVSKLADGAARQLLQTDAAGTGVEWTSNIDIPGTLDVTGAATFDGAVTVAGDLTVNGTTTTISTQNLLVEDKNIILGDVATPTDVTADGGGITLKGATDKTISWIDSTDAWTSSERFSVPLGSAAAPSLTFTGDPNTGIYSPGADQVAISTGGSGRLFVDASGNVGVGVSPSAIFEAAGSEPVFGLNHHVTQYLTSTKAYNATPGGGIALRYKYNSANDYTYGAGISFEKDNTVDGDFGSHITIQTRPNAGSATERLRITSAGLVGIGTSSPLLPLHVEATTDGPQTLAYLVNASTGGTNETAALAFGLKGTAGTGICRISAGKESDHSSAANTDTFLSFATTLNDTEGERLRITSAGLVGIGTSSPAKKLEVVEGDIQVYNVNAVVNTLSNYGLTFRSINQFGQDRGTIAEIKTYLGGGSDNDFGLQFRTQATTAGGVTTKMTLSPAGQLGIGTTSPADAQLYVDSSAIYGVRINHATLPLQSFLVNGTQAFSIGANSGGGGSFYYGTGNAEAARIDSSGRLLVGTSSAKTAARPFLGPSTPVTPVSQIEGYQIYTDEASRCFMLRGNSTGDIYPFFALVRSKGTALGSNAAVANGDNIGALSFQGMDGTNAVEAASIIASVDGTPGANDMPGRLVFSTCPDSGSSPVERVRITNAGRFNVVSTEAGIFAETTQGAGTSFVLFQGRHSATAGSVLSGTSSFQVFSNGNVQNTNNSYGAISDAKLKENIVDATSQWSDIKALQVRKYNFKEGQTHTQIGLVAQEVELVSPGLVSESPDRDAEGNDLGTVTKSVNYSVLYMKAVKALQEAMERIEQLESEMAEVKAQLS